MRNAVANAIIEAAKKDPNIYLITGDAGLGVWDGFRVEHPNQYINPGVNEALCVGMAAGMALGGYRPIYYNIAPFVIMRPYEQVRNDICYQELPVILVGTGSGVTYAPAGMTHYAVEDIALARTMPNLQIYSPADPIEAKACFLHALNGSSPAYIRVPKAGEPKIHKSEDIDITKPIMMRAGSDVMLVSHSAMVEESLVAADILAEMGVSAEVLSVPYLNCDMSMIAESKKPVFVVEEHFEFGGLGTILSEVGVKVSKIAIKNEYIHKVGNRDYLRAYYGIDAKSIADKIYLMIKKGL